MMIRKHTHSIGRVHTELTAWDQHDEEHIEGFVDVQFYLDVTVDDSGLTYKVAMQYESSNDSLTEKTYTFSVPKFRIFEDDSVELSDSTSENR